MTFCWYVLARVFYEFDSKNEYDNSYSSSGYVWFWSSLFVHLFSKSFAMFKQTISNLKTSITAKSKRSGFTMAKKILGEKHPEMKQRGLGKEEEREEKRVCTRLVWNFLVNIFKHF